MKKLSALVALSLCAAAATTSAQAQTCAAAVTIFSNTTFTSDTTGTTNWITSFGPLVSPSNDMLYTFVAGAPPLGTITPSSSTYQFAAYLIPSCADSGTEPSPIKATSTQCAAPSSISWPRSAASAPAALPPCASSLTAEAGGLRLPTHVIAEARSAVRDP